MKLHLEQKPQNVRLVLGFPGFGLVGTIATKFLIEHLDVERIGCVESDKLLPLAAIHKTKLIGPLDLFYCKKFKMVILQTLSEVAGFEWAMAEIIEDLSRQLNVKEIVILEGLPSNKSKSAMKTYFYSENHLKMGEKLGLINLQEGIMMGVTAAVMLRVKDIPVSSILAESPSKFPDSEAAAKAIQTLDQYWKIDIDYKPLMKAAQNFESMLKQMMSKVQGQQLQGSVKQSKKSNDLAYIG
ncbi:MAG: hypothetical protein CMH63_02590 [Nanoarchaeota archaeon]|jgi:uncharacterized protein|nr:hypothetical protein [Nanoarchaeota archaeon]|tara:strand:- start:22298 stop:23020 length:723 start_codon:yes stop_codon:yes gene_type:complete